MSAFWPAVVSATDESQGGGGTIFFWGGGGGDRSIGMARPRRTAMVSGTQTRHRAPMRMPDRRAGGAGASVVWRPDGPGVSGRRSRRA